MALAARALAPRERKSGRRKGTWTEKDQYARFKVIHLKGTAKEICPDDLKAYAAEGLLDTEFERAPLPDAVPREPIWHAAWHSESMVRGGRNRRAEPPRTENTSWYDHLGDPQGLYEQILTKDDHNA